jgi:hypothetical protein
MYMADHRRSVVSSVTQSVMATASFVFSVTTCFSSIASATEMPVKVATRMIGTNIATSVQIVNGMRNWTPHSWMTETPVFLAAWEPSLLTVPLLALRLL